MRPRLAIVILFLGLLLLWGGPAAAQRQLLVSASVSTEPISQGLLVALEGLVKTEGNLPIENAEISIQVTNPQNSSVFVGLIFSGSNGGYSIKFTLPAGAAPGNYSIFITVTKPGFERKVLQLFFLVSNPDFSLVAAPQSSRVKQGEEAQFTLTVVGESGFNSPVNFTLAESPQGVTFSFSKISIAPPGSTILTLNTTRSTPVGSLNVTIVAIGGGRSHTLKISLEVERADTNPPTTVTEDYSTVLASVALLVAVAAVSAIVLLRRKRSRAIGVRALLREARVDHGYVATARALAKLEELKALGQIGDQDYDKLKKEFEARLQKEKR